MSSSIEAGWGYKRGGGAGYERAREIYKALFEHPARFPDLAEQRGQAPTKPTSRKKQLA
jgi:hypothetical protein